MKTHSQTQTSKFQKNILTKKKIKQYLHKFANTFQINIKRAIARTSKPKASK